MNLCGYKNKKVLVTGHTGFKGSYLVKILRLLGADVYGYALAPTEPSLFRELKLDEELGAKSHIGDIRDRENLFSVIQKV